MTDPKGVQGDHARDADRDETGGDRSMPAADTGGGLGGDYARDTHEGGLGDDYARDDEDPKP
jgi:hypothetical protein